MWSSVHTVYVSPAEFITQPGLLQLITSRENNLSLGGWAWHKQLHPARGWPRGEALPSSLWNRGGIRGLGLGGVGSGGEIAEEKHFPSTAFLGFFLRPEVLACAFFFNLPNYPTSGVPVCR